MFSYSSLFKELDKQFAHALVWQRPGPLDAAVALSGVAETFPLHHSSFLLFFITRMRCEHPTRRRCYNSRALAREHYLFKLIPPRPRFGDSDPSVKAGLNISEL
jgi:hypothetical protein